MRNIILYISILTPLLALSQKSFSEKNPHVYEYRDYIENLSDTTLVTLNNEEFVKDNYDGGSQLTGTYYNNELVKISSWFGLSNGINTCDYYLKDGELFFVVEKLKIFKYDSETDQYDYTSYDGYADGWYLFDSGHLVDQISLGHWRFEDDTLDPEVILISEFKEYSKLLNKN
ncbi:hypothetical protein GZ212_15805 [Mangrovimonas sp. CR14]|uniref:hypothetical protein n=1 Tax=Mangrovimonas sp. CR14 TaxID=2706120 RepID=UPI00141EDEBE|nr:hypothetical protein [Mangrovimonas sp. CR14]NIK93626.1 hypothetical protein [Mangrovimonas sp. CR14]